MAILRRGKPDVLLMPSSDGKVAEQLVINRAAAVEAARVARFCSIPICWRRTLQAEGFAILSLLAAPRDVAPRAQSKLKFALAHDRLFHLKAQTKSESN